MSLYLPNGSLNFADFGIETYLMSFFGKIEVYSPEKIYPRPFWTFWLPAIASGTYKFTSLRRCVCPYMRYSEISESVHRKFLKFGTKLGLPNATEVTFSDFARKIPFVPFRANLGPKMPFLAQKWTFRPISWKRVIGSS